MFDLQKKYEEFLSRYSVIDRRIMHYAGWFAAIAGGTVLAVGMLTLDLSAVIYGFLFGALGFYTAQSTDEVPILTNME